MHLPQSARKAMLSLAATLMVVHPAQAQERELEVGSSQLSALFIQTYRAKFAYSVADEDGQQQLVGHWTDEVEISGSDGERQLMRKVVRTPVDGSPDIIRTMLANGATLAPVTTDQMFGPELSYRFRLDYAPGSVSQVLVGPVTQPARLANLTLDRPKFDLSFWSTLALTLPFSEGFEARLPVHRPQPGAPDSELFQVIGKEKVEALGKSLDAWRVAIPAEKWTFWLRKEKPYVVRIEHPLGDGRMSTSVLEHFE